MDAYCTHNLVISGLAQSYNNRATSSNRVYPVTKKEHRIVPLKKEQAGVAEQGFPFFPRSWRPPRGDIAAEAVIGA